MLINVSAKTRILAADSGEAKVGDIRDVIRRSFDSPDSFEITNGWEDVGLSESGFRLFNNIVQFKPYQFERLVERTAICMLWTEDLGIMNGVFCADARRLTRVEDCERLYLAKDAVFL